MTESICGTEVVPTGKRRRARQSGQAVLEAAILLPWLVLSFMGAYDMGAAAYALISLQSAARSAASWGAVSSANAQSAAFSTKACGYALDELRYAPGIGTAATACSGRVNVAATYLAIGADGLPAVSVSVTYIVKLLVVPGIFSPAIPITRTVQMPIRS
jgi:hypothetical protein